MRISYVTAYNAFDIHNWSGLGYNIARALENQQADMQYIGSLKQTANLSGIAKKIYYRLGNKTYINSRSIARAGQLANEAERRLKDTDIVFSPGTLPIALMKNRYPKVFYTDATFAGLLDFYPDFSNLCKETIKVGHYLEQKAIDNCALAIFASDWAAGTAIENYKVDPKKVKVVPFGANMDSQRSFVDIVEIVSKRSETVCKLLFLGVDWKRKGGDLALKVAQDLFDLGIDIELHIAGIKDFHNYPFPKFVINHGFISKSAPEGSKKIERLLAESHFLILPSLADCSPLVLNEAASFGLPAITTCVGGISTIVKDDLNGRVFPLQTNSVYYAQYIRENFIDRQKYQRLAYSSFDEYERRLNWDVSGKTLMELMEVYLR